MDQHGNIERAMKLRSTEPPAPPTLLNLPLELREHMYSYLFHINGCEVGKACHCGDGVSTANRQLYNEARALVYKCAKPTFLDIESCIRFLYDIRHNIVHINSLSITHKDASSQSHRLADVFRYKGIESLQNFHLKIIPHARLNRTPAHPVYLSFAGPFSSPAAVYDMSLRVCRHPLAEMKQLRRLTVVGSPQSDIEEAIFKASKNIQDLALSEVKLVKSLVTLDKPEGGVSVWNYSIEIID